MLLSNKCSIEEITVEDIESFPYFPRPEEDNWKIEMMQHLLEEKNFSILDDTDNEWLDFLASN